jgi:hypothetical protein
VCGGVAADHRVGVLVPVLLFPRGSCVGSANYGVTSYGAVVKITTRKDEIRGSGMGGLSGRSFKGGTVCRRCSFVCMIELHDVQYPIPCRAEYRSRWMPCPYACRCPKAVRPGRVLSVCAHISRAKEHEYQHRPRQTARQTDSVQTISASRRVL